MTTPVSNRPFFRLWAAIAALVAVVLLFKFFKRGNDAANREETKITEVTLTLSRTEYRDRLYGFWLGQSIANWTGLVTEMDKIGDIGDIRTGPFYTREDWGKPDQPSIWGEGVPSELSATIEFVFRGPEEIWGADDDTDIEYMYQYLLFRSGGTRLSPEQIRDGWLRHIRA